MEKLGKYVKKVKVLGLVVKTVSSPFFGGGKHNESALISNAWRRLMATNLESFPITVLLIAKETVLSPDQRKQTLK